MNNVGHSLNDKIFPAELLPLMEK